MATSAKGTAKQAALLERRQMALSLRKSGASYTAIASRIASVTGNEKYVEGHAYKDVAACLKQINEETSLDAEEYRSLELERLDTAQLAIARQVQAGHLGSIDRWLRISERRAALLGLDAPVKLRIEQGVESELSRFLDTLESALPSETYRQVLTAFATVEARAAAANNN